MMEFAQYILNFQIGLKSNSMNMNRISHVDNNTVVTLPRK